MKKISGATKSSAQRACRFSLLSALAPCTVVVLMSACGGGSAPPLPPAPTISAQPTDQSVPMGLVATFSVTAAAEDSSGKSVALQYQWLRDDRPIAGATASSYTSPPTAFTDSGSTFTVTVSDAGGSVTSDAATLTVTARAPNPQDLRFQLVDAPATVDGYQYFNIAYINSVSAIASSGGNYVAAFQPAVGTPLGIGQGCGVPPSEGPTCSWGFEAVPTGDAVLPSAAQAGLAAGYAGDLYANFPASLEGLTNALDPNGSGITPASLSSVVTSLDLDAQYSVYAVSWMQDPSQRDFDMKIVTVGPSGLDAAVAQEGASSRVVTAISYNNGQVTFLSYGWGGDTTTVYETQVSTAASASEVAAAGAALAQQGYIITALGRAGTAASLPFYLVGTRVAGDTMARPFMTAQSFGDTLEPKGYAIVGVIYAPTLLPSPYTLLGER